MTGKIRTTARVIAGVFAGILSLPALIFGGYFFVCWFRIHATDAFYVEYPYLFAGCLILGMGLLGAFCTVHGLRRRSFYGAIFVVPLIVGFGMMIYIPDGTPHVQRSMIDDGNYLSSVGSFLRVWHEAHHIYPGNQTEFLEALRTGPAAWQYQVHAPSEWSDYGFRGSNLPYEIVVIGNASGPRLNDISARPGVIYYCVAADRQQFWVTMTGLGEDVANVATLRTPADDPSLKPWIITASREDNR